MVYIREELNKAVDHETLEVALIKAAEEIGLKERKGKNVSKENGCIHTTFYFKGPLFPSMEVVTDNHGNSLDSFRVYAGHPFGRASKKTVERYIEKVHNYLKKS